MSTPMTMHDSYYILNSTHTNPKRLRKEREKARNMKKSQWWLTQLNRGMCHYCGKKVPPEQLTMDHIVPLARGGKSTHGNMVPACHSCNLDKKLTVPAEKLLQELTGIPT